MLNSPSIYSKKIVFLIALAGLFWAFLVNTHNMFYAEKTQMGIYSNGMIITPDDPSYLRPAENFANQGQWKDNSSGLSSYIQRPPGMAILHFIFYKLSPKYNYILHKVFNLCLHFLSLYFFGVLSFQLFGKRLGAFVQLVYAAIPIFWGYLFYYLTESITPSILVFLTYGYIQYYHDPKARWLIFQAFIIGILLIVRPQLFIFILPFLYSMYNFLKRNETHKWRMTGGALILAFGMFLCWQGRSAFIAGRVMGLHPIYDVTNNTQYRPIHRSLGELYKIWEHESKSFHTSLGRIWVHSVEDSTQLQSSIDSAIIELPKSIFQDIPENSWRSLFMDYYRVSMLIEPYRSQNLSVPGEFPQEKKLRLQVDSLTQQLKKKQWEKYYLFTPMHSGYFMFSKSQLNLSIFQIKYRGQWWMEALRWVCVLLIIGSIMASLLWLLDRKNRWFWLFALSILIYLFYLFYIQRMNEERYLVPLLPIVFLLAVNRINTSLKFWCTKHRNG